MIILAFISYVTYSSHIYHSDIEAVLQRLVTNSYLNSMNDIACIISKAYMSKNSCCKLFCYIKSKLLW